MAAKTKIESTAPVQLQPTITSPIADKQAEPEKPGTYLVRR